MVECGSGDLHELWIVSQSDRVYLCQILQNDRDPRRQSDAERAPAVGLVPPLGELFPLVTRENQTMAFDVDRDGHGKLQNREVVVVARRQPDQEAIDRELSRPDGRLGVSAPTHQGDDTTRSVYGDA